MTDKARKGALSGLELSDVERREVLEDLFVFGKENQRSFLYRMAVLLLLSTVIATCGLLANSAAVVIGAMLIAPMMRPVMSAAGAIVMGWPDRLFESLILVVVMTVAVVAIAIGIAQLAPDMVNIPEQVLLRTQPTYFDLIIALAAGAGGAYTMTRKESGAIPGVAMAVSLLPPLASCGVLLVFAENELALRAFILFVTNFFAMTFASTLVFLLSGISPLDARRESAKFIGSLLLVFLILVAGISVPLHYYSQRVWFDDRYEGARSEVLQTWLSQNNQRLLNIDINEEDKIIFLALTGRKPPVWLDTLHADLKQNMEESGLDINFKVQTSWVRSVDASWPPPVAGGLDPKEIIAATLEKKALLVDKEWGWNRTYYMGEEWVSSDAIGDYVLAFSPDHKLHVKTGCQVLESVYQLSKGYLEIDIDPLSESNCAGSNVDIMFVNDLSRVVDYQVRDNSLVLELGSGGGSMFFTSITGK